MSERKPVAADGLLFELETWISYMRDREWHGAFFTASEVFAEAAQLVYDDEFLKLLRADQSWAGVDVEKSASMLTGFLIAVGTYCEKRG